jgi:hypothetical protein
VEKGFGFSVWEVNKLNTLAYAGYIIAIVGGLLLLIGGVIGFFLSPFRLLIQLSVLGFLESWIGSIFAIIVGIIAMVGAKYVTRLDWGITLLILGAIVGGAGGLVFLGAILGLVSRIWKSNSTPNYKA